MMILDENAPIETLQVHLDEYTPHEGNEDFAMYVRKFDGEILYISRMFWEIKEKSPLLHHLWQKK